MELAHCLPLSQFLIVFACTFLANPSKRRIYLLFSLITSNELTRTLTFELYNWALLQLVVRPLQKHLKHSSLCWATELKKGGRHTLPKATKIQWYKGINNVPNFRKCCFPKMAKQRNNVSYPRFTNVGKSENVSQLCFPKIAKPGNIVSQSSFPKVVKTGNITSQLHFTRWANQETLFLPCFKTLAKPGNIALFPSYVSQR